MGFLIRERMSILKKVIELSNNTPLGTRDNWESYFMSIAYMVSLRSTCGSRRVGAVLVDGLSQGQRKIIATGYNGYPAGAAHCIDGGCPRFVAKQNGLLESGQYTNDYPCDAYHAEHNALIQIMNSNMEAKDAVMFTTTFPCSSCARKMKGAQIKAIYYCEGYPDEKSSEYLKRYGIKVIKINPNGILEKTITLANETPIGARDNWESYFMSLAFMASLRSKSTIERNGAILINDFTKKRIIATGYNGFPVTELPDEEQENLHPEDIYSASENVLNQVKITSISSDSSILFTTNYPTFDIAVEINGAGIKEVHYFEGIADEQTKKYFERYNIPTFKITL